MRKLRITALASTLALIAGMASAEDIKVGVSVGEHAEIMEQVAEVAKTKGLNIDIIEFTDYVVPNQALNDGDLNANSFQHRPYLENQIKEIATIEEEIAALRARQKAVEDLQSDRNLPVHLLSELVKQLPDGVYITSLKQADRVVTMQGMAQSNERVSEMLRNLANNTPWLSKPELVEIVANNVALTPRDQRRVSAFNLRFQLMRSSDVQKAMEAASAAAQGAATQAGK